jgi:hypothetical protein
MRNLILIAATSLLLALGVGVPHARADIDIEGTLLLGSGVDTGRMPHNPYAFQFGGALELIVNGFVVGARATRAITSGGVPNRVHLRSFGGDLGYEWELSILHIGPRVGLGRVSQINEKWSSFYVEPGAVAEVEIGWFVVGGDVRYRIVTSDMDRNGLLVYGKIGFRF